MANHHAVLVREIKTFPRMNHLFIHAQNFIGRYTQRVVSLHGFRSCVIR